MEDTILNNAYILFRRGLPLEYMRKILNVDGQ